MMSKLVQKSRQAAQGLLLGTWLVAATGIAGALVASTAHAQGQQVSKAVFDKYDPAREAAGKKDYATSLRLAKEGLAVAKTSYEKLVCLKIVLVSAYGLKNYPEEVDAIEQMLTFDTLPPKEKQDYQRTLGQLYAQLGKLDKAMFVMKEYIRATGGTPQDHDFLSKLYGTRDCPNSLAELDKALAGGKQPDEEQLKLQARCYFQSKSPDKQLAVAEELLRRFPKKEYYSQILGIYQEKKIDDMAMMALLRFGFDRDYLDTDTDFIKLADLALDVGTTAEAERVLEKGIARKVVKNADKAARLLVQAKTRAAEDKKTIGQLDAEARAGKNGESDVKVGERYLGVGEYDKAVEAIQRGLQPDRAARVKRPDAANMVLGIAALKAKHKDVADKAFTAAKADPRMAGVAKLWLGAT
jgi:tetratricopeptide (TPR) repeat protein